MWLLSIPLWVNFTCFHLYSFVAFFRRSAEMPDGRLNSNFFRESPQVATVF